MPTTLNKAAYKQLIDEDIEWLKKQPRSLERDHIEVILTWSISMKSEMDKQTSMLFKDRK